MTQLLKEQHRIIELDNLQNSHPVEAAVVIYSGSAISQNPATGGVRQLVTGGADKFVGFATTSVDNTSGVLGDKTVELNIGQPLVLDITGVTATTVIGVDVFAVDGNSFTLTAGTNTLIGKFKRQLSGVQSMVNISV